METQQNSLFLFKDGQPTDFRGLFVYRPNPGRAI